MKQQPDTYYDRWASMTEGLADWFTEQYKKAARRRTERQQEQAENGNPTDPEDPAQMPEPDKDPCTAMSESLRAALACTTPIFEPFGEFPNRPVGPTFHDLRPRLGDTFLTPLPDTGDRPTGEAEAASRFGHCYDQFGFKVLGVDSNGRLVVGAVRNPGAAQCGDIDCAPPATARSVGGQCRCVGPEPDGRLLRDLGRLRLCQTSDACFPMDEFFEILDRTLTERP